MFLLFAFFKSSISSSSSSSSSSDDVDETSSFNKTLLLSSKSGTTHVSVCGKLNAFAYPANAFTLSARSVKSKRRLLVRRCVVHGTLFALNVVLKTFASSSEILFPSGEAFLDDDFGDDDSDDDVSMRMASNRE